jgi:hypothetical protein
MPCPEASGASQEPSHECGDTNKRYDEKTIVRSHGRTLDAAVSMRSDVTLRSFLRTTRFFACVLCHAPPRAVDSTIRPHRMLGGITTARNHVQRSLIGIQRWNVFARKPCDQRLNRYIKRLSQSVDATANHHGAVKRTGGRCIPGHCRKINPASVEVSSVAHVRRGPSPSHARGDRTECRVSATRCSVGYRTNPTVL